jgi:hypothetical protein
MNMDVSFRVDQDETIPDSPEPDVDAARVIKSKSLNEALPSDHSLARYNDLNSFKDSSSLQEVENYRLLQEMTYEKTSQNSIDNATLVSSFDNIDSKARIYIANNGKNSYSNDFSENDVVGGSNVNKEAMFQKETAMKTIRISNSQDSRGLPDAGVKTFYDGDPFPSSSDPVIPRLSSQEDIYHMDRANTGTVESLIESTIDDTFSDYVYLSNRNDDNRKSIKLHDIQDSASQSDGGCDAKYAVKQDHKNSNFSENMIMEKSQTSHVIGGASISDRKITDRDCHSTPTTTNQIPQEAQFGVDSVEKQKFGLYKHEVGSMVLTLDVSSPVSFVDTPMMSKVSCYILMHFKPYPKLNQP